MTGERRMRAQQIIRLACDIKSVWKTNNPFEIAEKYGIKVLIRNVNIGDFKAQTLKMEGYPTIISINGLYSTLSQKVLCAHELGHALLHTEPINHFDVTTKMSIRMWNMKPICLPWHCFVMKMNLICRLPR